MTGQKKPPAGVATEMPANHAAGPTPDTGGGLLSRWSARKAEAARQETGKFGNQSGDEKSAQNTSAAEAEQLAAEAQHKANRQTAEAIDIGSADYDTDFTPFMKEGVPAHLRQQALKALWRTNPVLANVDGLNDYDEDFRNLGNVFEKVKSSWEVGRGYAGKAEEVAEEMRARDQVVSDEEAAKALARAEDESDIHHASADDPASLAEPQASRQVSSADTETSDGDTGESVSPESPDPGTPTNRQQETQDAAMTSEAETSLPVLAEPRSQRASLRQRLLQDKA